MEEQQIKNQIESILFACGRKISLEEIAKMMGLPTTEALEKHLLELQREYDERGSPLMILEEEKGFWKLTTREKYLDVVQKIVPETELSKTMMETLAVVAWKQPITQSEVIHIRTNKAYDHVKELEEMGFLVKERFGRTYLLKLTQKFYNYFDLSGAEAAKQLFKEFKDTEAQKKLTDASVEAVEELKQEEEGKEESEDAAEEVKREEQPEEEKEENVYSEPDREDLREDDEIKTRESGFMEGYENPEGVEKDLEEKGIELENPVPKYEGEEEGEVLGEEAEEENKISEEE